MKLFSNLFKKKELNYNPEDLKKIKRKDRKRSLELLNEYQAGLVILVDKDINQKDLMEKIRKNN
jgi:hypothetical protein